MNNKYKTTQRMPTLSEYIKICSAVGWQDYMNFEVAESSLKQSLFGVVVECDDEAIGMGRVVGDGKIYFYIQDIAVIPIHQKKGIGNMIMAAITEYIRLNAPEKAFVGLFAAMGKEPFYNRYGFNAHDGMTGMFGVVYEGEFK